MAQHEMTRHETRECAFYILFEMQFQNDTAEELFQVAEEAAVLKIHACCSVPVSFAWSRA